jgi:hypothetical protein
MASIRYLAMAVPFFAVAGFVLATGLMLAPHAFLGSITGNFEARAYSNMPPQSPAAVTSLSWGVDAKTGAVVGATAGAIKKNKDDDKDEKKDE